MNIPIINEKEDNKIRKQISIRKFAHWRQTTVNGGSGNYKHTSPIKFDYNYSNFQMKYKIINLLQKLNLNAIIFEK